MEWMGAKGELEARGEAFLRGDGALSCKKLQFHTFSFGFVICNKCECYRNYKRESKYVIAVQKGRNNKNARSPGLQTGVL
jgi:hypothetical protein